MRPACRQPSPVKPGEVPSIEAENSPALSGRELEMVFVRLDGASRGWTRFDRLQPRTQRNHERRSHQVLIE